MNFKNAFRMLPVLILAVGTVHAANGFAASGSPDQAADELSGLSAALESGHGMGLGEAPPASNLTYARQKFLPVPELQSMVLMVLGIGMVIFAVRRPSPA